MNIFNKKTLDLEKNKNKGVAKQYERREKNNEFIKKHMKIMNYLKF